MALPNPSSSFPLSPIQAGTLEQLGAELNRDQLQWASGFLAGLAAAAPVAPVSSVEATGAVGRLTVLYGSQTGNGRSVAEALADQAQASGLASRVVSMADYRLPELAKETALALVVSTHGEGDPPDDAEDLWESLNGPKAPDLSALQFAVLSLGDSSYEQFCQTGKDFDRRLEELGGSRFADRIDCDLDYSEDAGRWSQQVLERAGELLDRTDLAAPVLRAVPDSPKVTRDQPLTAQILVNQKITGRGSVKDVRHVELAIPESFSYQPGDALGIWPTNEQGLVDEVSDLLGGGASTVRVGEDSLSLQEALTSRLELTLLSRAFLQHYAELTQSDSLRSVLDDPTRLREYMAQRQVIDVLREIPPASDAQMVVDSLRRLTPRLYSIASAAQSNPGEVHLTVGLVDYQAFDRHHRGTASAFLADAEVGDEVPVYLAPNDRFRLPLDPDAPVIMIGPGTGVAPFRAFVEERERIGARGRNWLFFGNPNQDTDFLYQLEWLRWLRSGVLTHLDVAFSRDQADKVYVQHRIEQQAREIYRWLEEGAYLYVCGDANRMAPDVHAALISVLVDQAGLNAEAAEERLKTLKREGRYRKDTW